MDIPLMTLARDVSIDGENVTLIDIFDAINCRQFPCPCPDLVFFAKAITQLGERAGTHVFELRVANEDGQEIVRFQGQAEFFSYPTGATGSGQWIHRIAGASFNAPGDYSFELWIDGEYQRNIVLHIVETVA